MSDYIKMDIRGDKQLEKLLTELPKRSITKGFRRAFSQSASPIVKDAKKNCPKLHGALKKSIDKKLKTYSTTGVVVCLIGPDKNVFGSITGKDGKIRVVTPWRYAHLVHNGHAGPRPAAANPFLKKAYDSNQSKVISTAQAVLKETLEQEAERLK